GVTRKVARSTICICGNSCGRKKEMTSSSGRKRPRVPTSTKRGRPSGTFYAREPLLAALGVADEQDQAQGQGRDVREGLARADRKRCQHRVELAVESGRELCELFLRAVG